MKKIGNRLDNERDPLILSLKDIETFPEAYVMPNANSSNKQLVEALIFLAHAMAVLFRMSYSSHTFYRAIILSKIKPPKVIDDKFLLHVKNELMRNPSFKKAYKDTETFLTLYTDKGPAIADAHRDGPSSGIQAA